MIKIITDRLLIRDHVEEDIEGMHELLSNESAMFYLPDIKTKNLEESYNNLKVAMDEANSSNRSKFFFAIIEQRTKDYIGEIGFTKIIESKYGSVLELGYFIKESYWGKGIVTEASKAVIDYAFRNVNAIKIEAGCIAENKGSEMVMKKNGMIKEAEFKKHVLLGSELYDRVEYRLLKEEWAKTLLRHTGTTELKTERLLLRKFREEDATDMFHNWASDTEVTKYLTWATHSSMEVSKEIINIWINDYNNIDSYQWAIELKESGRVIGSISLMNIDHHNENCEIGYCIGKAFWKKGIVTEACLAIIDLAFKEIGFQRIMGRHDVENQASGRVMEKCGLKYEGTLRKINKNNKGVLVDCKYYSILKDEYFKSKIIS